MKKIALVKFAAAVLAPLAVAADTELLSVDGENGKLKLDGGGRIYTQEAHSGKACVLFANRLRLTTRKVKVDANKKYQTSLWVKAPGPGVANLYCGWVAYDKQGKEIPSQAFHSFRTTFTALVKAVKPGDKTIVVKDGSHWKKANYQFAVFNAKKDYSDLPNYSFVGPVTGVKKVGANWEISLAKPIQKAYAAGTFVREHQAGGDYCFIANQRIAPGGWQKLVSPKMFGRDIRRADSVRVVLIVNLHNCDQGSRLLLDDLKMVVDDNNVVF